MISFFKNVFDNKYNNNSAAFGSEPIDIVKKTLKYIKPGKILLLGVGNGRNASFYLKNGFEVWGVDLSEKGLDILRKKYPNNNKLKLISENVLDIDFPEKSFNLVTAIGLLHFLKKEDWILVIEKMKLVTNIGGYNMIVVRMTQNRMNNLPYIFSEGELKKNYINSDWNIEIYEERETTDKKIAILFARKLK